MRFNSTFKELNVNGGSAGWERAIQSIVQYRNDIKSTKSDVSMRFGSSKARILQEVWFLYKGQLQKKLTVSHVCNDKDRRVSQTQLCEYIVLFTRCCLEVTTCFGLLF